ncbi:MAG: hypothetical protein DHS20C13_28660 [Thermodesulfobacteriota bacterium]|nr:MAG: hypothetical protein DHS20C13_28660 [Thermodesulfobacteriota bacterium]
MYDLVLDLIIHVSGFIFVPFLGIASLYKFLLEVRLKRKIEDIPISKIHSAAQGYTAIEGNIEPIDALIHTAPLSQRKCLWYQSSISKLTSDGFENIFKDEAYIPYIPISDETGTCFIFHNNENTVIHTNNLLWTGNARNILPEESGTLTESIFSESMNWSSSEPEQIKHESNAGKDHRYIFREKIININEHIYALGHFETIHANDIPEMFSNYLIKGEHAEILKKWKGKTAPLITVFDKNKDGILSKDECETIHESALNLARKEYSRYKEVKYKIHVLKFAGDYAFSKEPLIISSETQRYLPETVFHSSRISLIVSAIFLIFWIIIFERWVSHIKNIFDQIVL